MTSVRSEEYRDGVSFEQAVNLVRQEHIIIIVIVIIIIVIIIVIIIIRQEYNVNYEVILRQLAPQEVFVQYGPEVSK